MHSMNKKNGIKLFIGGLSPETTSHSLKAHFEMFSVVVHSKIEVGKKLKQPKGYGYVTVPDMRAVTRILSHQHKIDGKIVDLEIAKGKSKGGRPAEDLNVFFDKEKTPSSFLPTNETRREPRKITSLLGHKGAVFNKYFSQTAQAPAISSQAQNQTLNSQVSKRVSEFGFVSTNEFNKRNQRQNQTTSYNHDQGALLRAAPATACKGANQQQCFGQQIRPALRVTETFRPLNHRGENLRFNPTGLRFVRVRGRW